MHINLSMHEHSDLDGVRLKIANHLLVCIRPACARLINTDFVGLTYSLNLSRTIEFKMFSTHC